MAFTIGNLGNIVADFKESLNQIFGLGKATNIPKLGRTTDLVKSKYGGSHRFVAENWLGNTKATNNKAKLMYGFAVVDLKQHGPNLLPDEKDRTAYYLDIPPQSITQKENFATNITATRKGIIVESEGVVFKDIQIKGTTGIFPGERGSFAGAQANFSDLTAPPSEPSGVTDQGLSKKSGVNKISGYQEFIFLRQFFLKYAHDKVSKSGNQILVFINEKDNQTLIVEPLDFTMERNAKSPMTYQYTITLKCLGTFDGFFDNRKSETSPLSLLEKIGNVSANLSAGLGQGRAAINATSTGFQKTFQAIDGTVNGPLRQLQFALGDLSEGITTVMSLPETLWRNFTTTVANIREHGTDIGNSLGVPTTLNGVKAFNDSATAKAASDNNNLTSKVENQLTTDSRVTVPREFVINTKNKMRSATDNLADAYNMTDPLYNTIKGRTVTETPGVLKVVSDDEFLILGNMQTMTDAINSVLSTNDAFQTEVESAYQEANLLFSGNSTVVEQNFLNISQPDTVRQILIKQQDSLERISQRELGDASRWVELVILNKLKPPYLDSVKSDGVKAYGENILVPGR